MVEKAKAKLTQMNQTTTATTGVGAGIAIIIIFTLQKFGIEMSQTEAGMLVGGFTTVVNYFIPKK